MTNATQPFRRPRAMALLATASTLALAAMAGQAQAGTTVDNSTATVPGTFASPFTVVQGLFVGVNGTGEVDISGGGIVNTTNNCFFDEAGQNASGIGTISVDGAGSKLDNGNCGVIVGNAGHGTLNITNGGLVATTGPSGVSTGSVVGQAATGVGIVNVGGTNSTWSVSGLLVGGQGTGTVNINAGGLLTHNNCSTVTLGGGSNAVGSVNVSGAGAHWANGGCAIIAGDPGTGNLTVSNGGLVDGVLDLQLANTFATSHGHLIITGAGSQVTTNGLEIGEFGVGTVDISAGGHLTDQTGIIGDIAGSSGTADIDGAGSVWTNTFAVNVGKNGAGSLDITNGGVVTSVSGGVGGSTTGSLFISGAGSRWTMTQGLTVGGQSTISLQTGALLSDSFASVAAGNGNHASVIIDGAGTTWTNAGSLSGGGGFNAQFTMTVQNGGSVTDTTASIQAGAARVTGAGSTWTNSGNVSISSGSSQAYVDLDAGGLAIIGGGSGTLTLGSGSNSFGTLSIGARGSGAALAPGSLQAGSVVFSSLSGSGGLVNFNHTSSNYVFSTPITGGNSNSVVQELAGVTVLTGASTYIGSTQITGGTLLVNGSLGLTPTTVATTGILGGTGVIGGGVNVTLGGTLKGVAGQTLTTGALTMQNSGIIDATLGAPGNTALFHVNGNLTLDGTLNVTNAGAFGLGLYRLIDYTGALNDLGLNIGATPAGFQPGALVVQTSVANQVNLVVSANAPLQFWDGASTVPTNTIVGGAGTWKIGPTNWTDSAGSTNGAWTNIFGIFAGTGGAVTIDNSGGAVSASGVQFAVNGYSMTGGALTLTGASTVRVGDGTAGGAAYTATISAPIAGTSGLSKTDLGTLILSGTNTYSGGTTVAAGTLSVGAEANLGLTGAQINLTGGNLAFTNSFITTRSLVMQSAGAIDVASGKSVNIQGSFQGAGALTKTGAGLLEFQGVNPTAPAITVGGGTLQVLGSLGSPTVAVQSGATLFGSGSITGTVGVANGATLSGFNATNLATGALTLNNTSIIDAHLGAPSASALFTVNGALTLDGQLNVTDAGGFGQGLYRLFDYTGALTNNVLTIGTAPGGVNTANLSIQTSVNHQVNLVYALPGVPQFWDGANTSPTGTTSGGAGTWKVGPTNWTDSAGASNGAWTGIFAIFAGTGGAVVVDNSGGAVNATGLQFATNGYSLSGGPLTLTGASPIVRVGDGSAASANYVATIAAPIAGTGGLTKTDLGTLVLTGVNTFTGGLILQTGAVSVGADNNLGAAAGSVVFNGGNLFVTNSFATTRTFDIQTNFGTLDVAAGKVLTLNGAMTSGGQFYKTGAGGLTIGNGGGAFFGSVDVQGGDMIVNGAFHASGVTIYPGSSLAGVGSIFGVVSIGNGATLKGVEGQTLTMGSLTFLNGATIDATLGAPGGSTLFNITGSLDLDGTINITNAGGFGLGVYRLFDYGGGFTDNGLLIGSVPAGAPGGALSIQTSVAGQVNLVYGAGSPIQFWNGSTTAPTGTVVGGAGTWKNGPTNWTDSNGATSTSWGGGDAVFMGAPGLVTIDNSNGQVLATSIQFATNGYSLGGGALALTGATPTLRVGDGSAGGAAYSVTVGAVLTGSGGLIKSDLGTLVLTGANTFTGGLSLSGGVVSVGADANLGAAAGSIVFNNGALTATGSFTNNRALVFPGTGTITTTSGVVLDLGGALSGSGAFTKAGPGMLKLSGAGSFNGSTTVAGGTLQVNGTLGGTIAVQSGARLQGIGTVGSTTVASGGTLAPGNSIGTLTVAGNVTYASGSTYEVELNAAGQADLTHATGTVTINGGTVAAMPAAGLYSLGHRYTVITADGGRSGTFTTLTGGALAQPFLQLSLAYDATHAYIDVTRNGATFCSVAATANQCAAAGGAESLGQGNTVYNAIANLGTAAQARAAFDGLSGEVYAQNRGVQIEDSRFVRDTALGRLSVSDEGRKVWGQVFGAQGSADGDGNAAKVTRTTDGFLMGVDAPAGDHWRLGVLGGYSKTRLKISDRMSSGSSDNYHLGAYAAVGSGQFSARFGAAYTWHDLGADRAVAFTGFSDTLGASGRATTGQVFGEMAYRYGSDARRFEPFAGLALVSMHTDDFTEHGGAAALKGIADSSQTTFATLGVRGQGSMDMQSGGVVTLRGTLAWRGASGDTTPAKDLRFASGGSAFTVEGAPIAKSALVLNADLSVAMSDRARLSFSYAGQLGDGTRDNSVKAALTIGF